MAEDRKADVDGGTFVKKKSKVDQEMDIRESDENSGGSSEADDNQHRGSDETRHKKGRRPRRLKGGKRHNRKHHPYGGTSVSSIKQCPDAPRNTTQYLIDDHVKHNISPDLSNRSSPAYNCIDEAAEFRKDFKNMEHEGIQRERTGHNSRLAPHYNDFRFGRGRPGERSHFEYDQEFEDDYEKTLLDLPKEELVQITSALLRSGKRSGLDSRDLKEESERDIDSLFNMQDADSPNTTPLSSWN